MMKIGLRSSNWPSDAETQLLIQHIVFNYSNHTLEEVKLGFDLAIAGLLNVDANCYENFSCLYFSSVMNAFRVWAGQTHKQNVKPKPAEQKIYTEAELQDILRGDMEAAYQRILLRRQNVAPEGMKALLVQDGLMKEEEDIVPWLEKEIGKGRKNLYVKS